MAAADSQLELTAPEEIRSLIDAVAKIVNHEAKPPAREPSSSGEVGR